MPVASGLAKRLTDTPGSENPLNWRPDGGSEQLAFSPDSFQQAQLVVRMGLLALVVSSARCFWRRLAFYRFLSNHIAIKAMAGKLPVTRESGPAAVRKNGTLRARYFSEKQLFRPYPEYTCDIPGFLGQRRFYAAFKPGRIIIY